MLDNLTAAQIQKGFESIAYNVSHGHPLVTILEDAQDAADCTDEEASFLWAQWSSENETLVKEWDIKAYPSKAEPKALKQLDKFKNFIAAAEIPEGMKGLKDYAANIMPKTEEEASALLAQFHNANPKLKEAFEKFSNDPDPQVKLDIPTYSLEDLNKVLYGTPEMGGFKETDEGLGFKLKEPTAEQKAAMAKEEAASEGFDLSKFIPDVSLKETVKSSGSENVYTVLAQKNGSKVAVSVTLNPVKAGPKQINLNVLCRILEIPVNSVSSFANPGETREYVKDGKPCEVFMLKKFNWSLCNAQCSPWEVRCHLEAGVKEQITAYVWRLLMEAGCAINCTDLEEMQNVLFVRLDQLPDQPALYWKDLGEDTPGNL